MGFIFHMSLLYCSERRLRCYDMNHIAVRVHEGLVVILISNLVY